MQSASKRKISLTPAEAEESDLDVSAMTGTALEKTVTNARKERWLRQQNADAFAAQAEWHATHGHPLANIMAPTGRSTWKT